MRRLLRDSGAVTGPVSVAILVGITIVLAVLLVVFLSRLDRDGHVPLRSGAKATYGPEGYWIEPTGPSELPVDEARLFITIDGNTTEVPLSDFSAQLGGQSTWAPGDRLCIVGAEPGCYASIGQEVEVSVFTDQDLIFTVTPLRKHGAGFVLDPAGGIVLAGPSSVRLDLVGAQITCGAGGPQVPVTVRLSIDGGASYQSLFGGLPVNQSGGQSYMIQAVNASNVLGVEGRAALPSCSNFDSTYNSLDTDPHVLTLLAGDAAPDKAPYAGQAPLASFLAPFVNTQTQTMVLDANQVIVIFEFVSDLSSSAADFQDLVVLFTID